jgi:uncharacterized protein YndB with AHSA1/START domain
LNQIMLLAVLCALTIAGVGHAGDRVLRHEAIIDAPVTDVWRAWTTDAGITSWMVPHGTVDLRVGGAMRTSYDPTADLDGDAAIVNRILAYEPERMLAMQNVQAPPGFKHVELFRDTWSVVRFEPIGAMRTRLIVSGYGYGEGEEWDELYGFFDQGNAYLMSQLQKVFTPEDVERDSSGAAVLEAMRPMVGGCWRVRYEQEDGSVLRSIFTVREMNGGSHLLAEGWLGDDETMKPHAVSVFGTNPETGTGWQWEFVEGDFTMIGPAWVQDGEIHIDIMLRGPDGVAQSLPTRYKFLEEDLLQWSMGGPDGGPFAQLIFERVPIEQLGDWVHSEAGRRPIEVSAFAESTTDRAIVVEREVAAPPADVRKVWTTPEGFKETFDREMVVDLQIGGRYEIYWDTSNRIGSNGCQVLAYQPEEYIAFSWNAPPSIPEMRSRRSVVTVSLDDLGDGRTMMRLRNDGYGDGPGWDQMYAYFDQAWPWVMDQIAARFAPTEP